MEIDQSKILGKTEEEAAVYCKSINFQIRTVSIDGKHFFVTMDYRLYRVNIELESGIITRATIG